MNKTLLIVIFVSVFSFTLFAQTNQSTACPMIDISGGLGERDKPIMFIVNVKDYDLEKLTFHWKTSAGKIVEGINTTAITVDNNDLADGNITATVEIEGLPKGCNYVFSETRSCGLNVSQPLKIGEFLDFTTEYEKDKLVELQTKLQNDRYSQVYVVGRFKGKTSQKDIKLKFKNISKFLIQKFALDADRITMVKIFAEQEYLEMWLVPPGAKNPEIK